jgi:hypothetical protein
VIADVAVEGPRKVCKLLISGRTEFWRGISVSKYMVRGRKPPSQTWRTFLENHLSQIVSVDFFTVPTIRFQVLYVFLVLVMIAVA